MIPKIIHYCWFGRGAKPALALKCIESWKKFCPDYEIKEWNEDNFDLSIYPYAKTEILTGLMACQKGQSLFEELLHEYDDIHFVRPDGNLDMTTNVTRITNTCAKYGFVPNNQLQTINGFTLLPKDYLCPKSYSDGKIYLSENTLCIHHFSGSWHTPYQKMVEKVSRIFGKRVVKICVWIKGLFGR